MPPLISVIIPTYNRKALLSRALASIAAQTWRPLEVIVVDDGSTDGTADAIGAHQAELARGGIELRYLTQTNGGPAKARNAGIAQSRGQLISFLDSDDMWKPAFAQTLAGLLDRFPSAGLAFGGYIAMDINEKELGLRPSRLPPEPVQGLLPKPFERIINYMPFGTPCVTVRRAVLDEVGVFDTSYRIGEDWDLWFRISLRYDFAYTLEGLALCREHQQNTPKYNAQAMAQRVRLDLKYIEHVTDPQVRAMLQRRLNHGMVYLQEQLMREGTPVNGCRALLENGFSPRSLRFRLGALMSRQPALVGRVYAGFIRAVGGLHRTAVRE